MDDWEYKKYTGKQLKWFHETKGMCCQNWRKEDLSYLNVYSLEDDQIYDMKYYERVAGSGICYETYVVNV